MPDLALRELATEGTRVGCRLGNTSFIVFRSRYKSNCDSRSSTVTL
jgi:hypothetical protein